MVWTYCGSVVGDIVTWFEIVGDVAPDCKEMWPVGDMLPPPLRTAYQRVPVGHCAVASAKKTVLSSFLSNLGSRTRMGKGKRIDSRERQKAIKPEYLEANKKHCQRGEGKILFLHSPYHTNPVSSVLWKTHQNVSLDFSLVHRVKCLFCILAFKHPWEN